MVVSYLKVSGFRQEIERAPNLEGKIPSFKEEANDHTNTKR